MNTTEVKWGLEILLTNLTHIQGTKKVRKKEMKR